MFVFEVIKYDLFSYCKIWFSFRTEFRWHHNRFRCHFENIFLLIRPHSADDAGFCSSDSRVFVNSFLIMHFIWQSRCWVMHFRTQDMMIPLAGGRGPSGPNLHGSKTASPPQLLDSWTETIIYPATQHPASHLSSSTSRIWHNHGLLKVHHAHLHWCVHNAFMIYFLYILIYRTN